MKISVLRENSLVSEIDLTSEIHGNGGGELTFVIGRTKDCHIRLDDQQVSRNHAYLTYKNATWWIRRESDFGQLIVNGAQVIEKELADNDHIAIGPFVLTISEMGSSQPQETEVEEPVQEPDELQTKTLFEPTPSEETKELIPDEVEQEAPPEVIAPVEPEDEHVLADGFDANDFEAGESTGEFDTDDSEEDNQVGEFTSVGSMSAAFSGENEESVFPEDNDEQVDEFGDFQDSEVMSTDDDESTKVFQTFAKFELELFGEFAPYDKYSVDKNIILIGRDGSKCDIVLNDPEVSSVHAKVIKNNVSCSIEDQQSGNGTLLNGERINKSSLTNGDEFVIGSTTFTLKIVSDFLEEEKDRLMPVEENQVVEVEEVVEVDSAFDDETSADIGGDSFASQGVPKNQSLVDKFKALPRGKKIIYTSVAAMLLLLLLGDDESTTKAPVQTPQATTAPDVAENTGEEEIQLSPEQLELVEASYQLANEMIQRGLYDEALRELDNNVLKLLKEYKNAGQLKALALRGIQERERIEEERRRRIQEEERKLKVVELVERARKAVQEKNVQVAESLFAEITLLDPNNFDVSAMKIEIDAWKREQERAALEKAQKEAERQRKITQLQPGKTFYLQKEWYNAVVRLTEFLQIENMDEDLTKEATQMLQESKNNLNAVVGPLLGRARSLREGQDLKGAYENYSSILSHEPTNAEALNEMNEIREILHARSRRVYREAIISESLSLFQDAKEKFQEVQQISPSDSEYYIKASGKLKDYID